MEMPEEEKERDEDLFRRAVELVIRHKQGSVSLLQRRLAIGYQRAARLIDQLEQEGIVGPYDGSKAREVLVDETYLEREEWLQKKSQDTN
jgi:S-DNA-T family DNA segregation ATPase FtsK/SpoIIIE